MPGKIRRPFCKISDRSRYGRGIQEARWFHQILSEESFLKYFANGVEPKQAKACSMRAGTDSCLPCFRRDEPLQLLGTPPKHLVRDVSKLDQDNQS